MTPQAHRKAEGPRILLTGVSLTLLAAASFGTSFQQWRFGLPLALGFSVLKASLVLSIFMGLFRERASIKLGALSAVVMLGLLVGFMLADVAEREAPPLLPFSELSRP